MNATYKGKLTVAFYTDLNFFSLQILETLINKNCLVNVITQDYRGWNEQTKHLNKNLFGITPVGSTVKNPKYNYALYTGGFFSKKNFFWGIDDFLQDKSLSKVKALIVFPTELHLITKKKLPPLNTNIGLVYVGDVLGPRLDLYSDLKIARMIKDIVFKRHLTLEIGERFYPASCIDYSKEIVRWLFSFGPYGKQIFLLGPKVSAVEFWNENKKMVPELKLKYIVKEKPIQIPSDNETYMVESSLNLLLKNTYDWIISLLETKDKNPPNLKEDKIKQHNNNKTKERRHSKRYHKIGFALAGLFCIAPLIFLLGALGLSYFSYLKFLNTTNTQISNQALIAKTLFVLAKSQSGLMSNLPFLGKVYQEINYISEIGEIVSETAASSSTTFDSASEVFSGVLGNKVYDPTESLRKIQSTLFLYFQTTSIVQANTKEALDRNLFAAKYLSENVDIERFKTLFSKGSILLENMPEIFGKQERKAYLILFQNNMELRPTGGFIGSYGIMNFDGGRLNELSVNDVYSADGQLKGHVEPPAPIRDYLGEANWWLRDSNWDPDFVTSAQRAEWFLDKEVDQKVDGVIAVDLELVKDILKETGGLFLPDFNITIDENNLYEKTQSEVQDNFFPGSRKKASFLTALSRKLIDEVSGLDSAKKVRILKAFYKNLEERHVQVYLHNQDALSAIDQIGWSGRVRRPSCGDGCFADFVAIVEANLGVNKSNYFIRRDVVLDVDIEGLSVKRKMSLNLLNTANPALGVSGKYKTYSRFIVPQESDNIIVKSKVGMNQETLTPEVAEDKGFKEIGVLTEVLGGNKQTIELSWSSVLKPEETKYGLFIRKQGGLGEDPWSINLGAPFLKLNTKPPFDLTKDGRYSYNTVLSRDFVGLFAW